MSELGAAFVELVSDRRAFPDEAARDLLRILGHALAAPHPAAERWDVLSPLVVAIRQTGGRFPTVREYEALRDREWPDAPAASTLTERYGSWLAALTSASHLLSLSRENPVWPYKPPRHRPYTPAECLAALAKFRKQFGAWPQLTEYRAWSRSARRAAHVCGANDPCLPDVKVVLRRFGTFDRALQAAKDTYRELKCEANTPG